MTVSAIIWTTKDHLDTVMESLKMDMPDYEVYYSDYLDLVNITKDVTTPEEYESSPISQMTAKTAGAVIDTYLARVNAYDCKSKKIVVNTVLDRFAIPLSLYANKPLEGATSLGDVMYCVFSEPLTRTDLTCRSIKERAL